MTREGTSRHYVNYAECQIDDAMVILGYEQVNHHNDGHMEYILY